MKSISSLLLPHEKKALEDFHRKLQKVYGKRLKTMKLFGSKVRGTDRLYSDLDVCVLLDIDRIDYKTRETVYGLAWEGLHHDNVDISPLLYTVKEFQDLLNRERLIAKTIQEEGILI